MTKHFALILTLFSIAVHSQATDVFNIARKGTASDANKMIRSNPLAFNTVNDEGFSPLILACYHGNNDVAKIILDRDTNVNLKSNMGTALMACVVKSNVEMVKLLLEKKADPNIADANGTTALIYAATFKNHDIAAVLIASHANPDVKDNRGNSAVDYALLANDDKLIEILKTK